MGWGSGVFIFDEVAEVLLRSITPLNENLVKNTLKTLINALEDQDCDTLDGSNFMGHPIVREIMQQLHPDWDCWKN